ncbi:glycosyl transferase [Leptolyngbya sp. 'hensonii']|uniref:glycosyltransferase n=1 Tax=Leptolyngbya sp. 'hensonii' TaxID=1922337 RepID=UPI00094FE75E|nr:glycosyltransferase [Leptolyngbya sp. 'hensonii']OLP20482.1 glycosyl transferase [Leptolyngbya sp. 'hensonii']
MSKPVVALFSSLLLPPSQTFIKAQGEQLQQFTPYYVGSRLVPGLALPPERTIVVNSGNIQGQIQEALFKLTGLAPRLYQQVRQLNPVLIHAQFGLSGALVLPLVRSLNLPLIVHFRGADATLKDDQARYASLNHWIYLRRREALKQETTLFITVSKFIQEKLLEQGFPANKIIAHYSGISLHDFSPDPALPRQPIVLFVGRLTKKKGCEYLIQAMQRVQTEQPEVELVIIGDGPLRASLETQAAQLPGRYQFLGTQVATVVRKWMNQSRLLVAPSVTATDGDSEGLPNVVLEAQAMGLPVVSTLHAGIPEGVLQGETGFLAAERNPEELAAYCLQLLQDPDLWQRFSQQGQTHVRSNFDRTHQVEILEQLYNSVLQSHRSCSQT